MYRASGSKHGSSSNPPYKKPQFNTGPTAISVPVEGGRSASERVIPTPGSSQSSQSGNFHGRRQHQGYNRGHPNANPRTDGRSPASSSWQRAGCDGFAPGTGDFGAGRGYRDDTSDPMSYPRPAKQVTTDERELIRKRNEQAKAMEINKAREQDDQREREEDRKRREEEEKRKDEERFASSKKRYNLDFSAKKARSTSAVAAKAPTVHQWSSDKPPPDLSDANARIKAIISKGSGESKDGERRKNDDNDELAVVSLPITKKDLKGKARDHDNPNDGRTGADRIQRPASSSDAKPKTKVSNLGKLKKNGFDPSPSPEKRKSAAPGSGGQQSPAAPHRSLADMFKERQEADSLDAAIEEAEETARKHADQDSDLEIVDPESERENSILDEPDREETPEELRFDHYERVDPSALCPFCDQPLPTDPSQRLVSLQQYLLERPHIESRYSARNPNAKYLPIVEIASFCQLHKVERTIIPEGIEKGYPMVIDWKALPRRIERDVAPRLSQIVRGETSSDFLDRARQDWDRNNGFKRSNITAEWDSFHLEEPGYYGPRGFECIHSTLRQLFTIDNPILTDSNISPFSSDFYLRRILVPEAALDLIRTDLGLERDEVGLQAATDVLERSRPFGKAAHAVVEDVEKERKRARKEDLRKEEVAERERQEKAERERQEQEEAEREEQEAEERRAAAEAPRFRQPKALANLKTTNAMPLSTPASSSSSAGPRRRFSPSPDLNRLVGDPAKSRKVPSTSLSGHSQPSIATFMKRTHLADSDLEQEVAKELDKPSSSNSTKGTGEGREALVIDSSSDEEDDVAVVSSTRSISKKTRRASSPEKARPRSSPDPPRKKRRASSPIAPSPKKKSKARAASARSDRAASPIKDQTNKSRTKARLDEALEACSELESEVETNFKSKRRKEEEKELKRKKERANAKRKRTIAEKQREKEIDEEEARARRKKGDKNPGSKGKEKPKKSTRPRLDADSSDSD